MPKVIVRDQHMLIQTQMTRASNYDEALASQRQFFKLQIVPTAFLL